MKGALKISSKACLMIGANPSFIMRAPGHVRGRAVEPLQMGHFEQAEAELFQIGRVADAAQRDAVVDFIKLGRAAADGQEQSAVRIGQGDDRAPCWSCSSRYWRRLPTASTQR